MSGEERVCVQGKIGPVTRLQSMEVVFPIISDKGEVKVWLSGSAAHEEQGSVKENMEVKIYGKMLGNLLMGQQVIFSPSKRPGYKNTKL